MVLRLDENLASSVCVGVAALSKIRLPRTMGEKSNWSSMSIQERIRAMNETLDHVEDHQPEPLNLTMTESSEATPVPSPKRNSVIAIWEKQRNSTSPRSSKSPSRRAESLPKRVGQLALSDEVADEKKEADEYHEARSVRDIWNQRVAQQESHVIKQPKAPAESEPADLTITAPSEEQKEQISTPRKFRNQWASRGLEAVVTSPDEVAPQDTTPRRSVVDIWKRRASPSKEEDGDTSDLAPRKENNSDQGNTDIAEAPESPTRQLADHYADEPSSPVSVGKRRSMAERWKQRMSEGGEEEEADGGETTTSVSVPSTMSGTSPVRGIAARWNERIAEVASKRQESPRHLDGGTGSPTRRPRVTDRWQKRKDDIEPSASERIPEVPVFDNVAVPQIGTQLPEFSAIAPSTMEEVESVVSSEKEEEAITEQQESVTSYKSSSCEPSGNATKWGYMNKLPSTNVQPDKNLAHQDVKSKQLPVVTNLGAKTSLDKASSTMSKDAKSVGSKSLESRSQSTISTKMSLPKIQAMPSTDSSKTSGAHRWMRHAANRPLGPMVGAVVPTPKKAPAYSEKPKPTSRLSRYSKPLKIPDKRDTRIQQVESNSDSAFDSWGDPELKDEEQLSPRSKLLARARGPRPSPAHNKAVKGTQAKRETSPARSTSKDLMRMGQKYLSKRAASSSFEADGFPRVDSADEQSQQEAKTEKKGRSTSESPQLFPDDVFSNKFIPSPSKNKKTANGAGKLTVNTASARAVEPEKKTTPSAQVVAKKKQLQAQRKKFREAAEIAQAQRPLQEKKQQLSEYTSFDMVDADRTWSTDVSGKSQLMVQGNSVSHEDESPGVESTTGSTPTSGSTEYDEDERSSEHQHGASVNTGPVMKIQREKTDHSRGTRYSRAKDEHSFIAQEVARNTPRGSRKSLQSLPQQVFESDEQYLDSFMRQQAAVDEKERSSNSIVSPIVNNGSSRRSRTEQVFSSQERSSGSYPIAQTYSTETDASSEFQSLESRTTRSDPGTGSKARKARIERLRKAHGTFVSDEFVQSNSQNFEALQTACGAVTIKDVASDIVGELRSTLGSFSLGLLSTSGSASTKNKKEGQSKIKAKQKRSTKLPKQGEAPFDEDIAIEVEYMDDSQDDDDPKQDLGMCAAMDEAAMAMQWSGDNQKSGAGGIDCTRPCGEPVSPAGQPSYEEASPRA